MRAQATANSNSRSRRFELPNLGFRDKIGPRTTGGPGTPTQGESPISNQPLSDILADAFGVYWNQISGPDWIATDRYDIAAKVPEGTTKEQARRCFKICWWTGSIWRSICRPKQSRVTR